MPATTYTVAVDETLAGRLKAYAAATKKPAEELIADCVSLQLDTVARFLFLIERMDIVDQGLIDIASFVGELASEVVQARSGEQPS